MKKIQFIGSVLLLLLVFGLAKAQDTTEFDTVKVLYPPFNSYTVYDVGIAEGYFAEQNIEIEKVTFLNPSEALLPFLQREMDVWIGAPSPLTTAAFPLAVSSSSRSRRVSVLRI